jgi:hypothetical protein
MVDIAQRQRTTFPTLDNAVDAAAKYRSDYDRANTEYNRFHARSDPAAQLAEQAAYADPSRMNPTFVNARNPRVFRNTQWSPNYPGNKYTTQFTVGSSGGTGGLESLPRGEYYNRMKDTYDFLMNEMYKPDVRRDMGLEPYPDENNEEVINAEEEGDGIFNNPYYNRDNPLMDELFRLNRERRMEELRRRMMEENRRLQMELSNEMLMNPNKFNLMPGTGNLNPIFGGDPYWNI